MKQLADLAVVVEQGHPLSPPVAPASHRDDNPLEEEVLSWILIVLWLEPVHVEHALPDGVAALRPALSPCRTGLPTPSLHSVKARRRNFLCC